MRDVGGWLNSFVLTFVPLFIVLDAVGNLPFVMALSQGLATAERRRTIHLATLTATVVGLAFLFFGRVILGVMGISVPSFAVAGGAILFVLSVRYLTIGRLVDASRDDMMAVVPIGTPLLVGPATITTLLILATQYPLYVVLISFILNLALAWFIFMVGEAIVRFLGKAGLKAVSEVFNLLLAAIAVSMVLRGLGLIGIIPPSP